MARAAICAFVGLVIVAFGWSALKAFRQGRAELNVAFVASRDENPILFWAYSLINLAFLLSGLAIVAMVLIGEGP